MSTFRTITTDTLGLVEANNLPQAKTRVTDLETAWDNNQAQLKPMSPDKWTVLDVAIDDVLKKLRAPQPDAAACRASLQALIDVINSLDPQSSGG